MMKAAHYSKYGNHEVFSIVEKEIPSPKNDEVLVKVFCTTVNRTDTGMTSAIYFVSRIFTGLISPKRSTPGTDFSGIVEAVGSSVTKYSKGDEVFGFNDQILSSQAEYMLIKEGGFMTSKPPTVSHQIAAASCEGPHYALNVFKNYGDIENKSVLIYGATGAIGSAAVQLAKRSARLVDAVANTKNLKLVSELGAQRVFDYEKEDFTDHSQKYDLIVDAVGKSSFKVCKKLLIDYGVYISSELGERGVNIWLALTNKHVNFPVPSDIKKTLSVMKDLLERGEFKPVIDREYPLEEIKEAYKYVESGQKTGNVILRIQ